MENNRTSNRLWINSIRRSPLWTTFRENITDFWYLEDRSWFVNNPNLHFKLKKIIDFGLAKSVSVISGDFEEHLDTIIESYYESKNELEEKNEVENVENEEKEEKEEKEEM